MSISKQFQLGDVEVKKITISKPSGEKMDISSQIVMISLYEDILCPYLIMDVEIRDSIGLLRTFPIIGEEIIELEFNTPGRKEYKTKLRVYTVEMGVASDTQTTQGYTLKCISQEVFKDAIVNVEKGYKDNIHNMIADIIRNVLKSKKNIVHEPSKGIQHFAFTRKNPFEAINILRKRAASQEHVTGGYYFFENKYGYNFNTLEGLMDNNKSHIGDKIFTRHQITTDNFQNPEEYRQILSYSVGTQFNTVSSLQLGALKGNHETFDILKKEFKQNPYTIHDFSKFKTAEKSGAVAPFGTDTIKEFGSDTAIFYYNISNSDMPDTYLNDTLMKKIAFTGIHLYGQIDLYCYGDSEMTIGDVITLKIPRTDGTTKRVPSEEPLQNGNYIVTKMNHEIQFSTGTPKHTMTFTCIRGVYKQ